MPPPKVDTRTLHSLRHVLLKARGPGPDREREYEKIYEFWLKMWRSTFSEVDPNFALHSDHFLTQREVSAVFSDDQVVGLLLYDFRDLRVKAHRDLSYFQHYPTDTLDTLYQQGFQRVMQIGQLTVHPDWRKNRVGPFMSDTLTGLGVRRFLASDAEVMLAFTRNDRGTQHLGYRFGAVPLRENQQAHGISSDVIAFYRDRVCNSSLPEIADAVERLWSQTSVSKTFSNLPPSFEQKNTENDLFAALEGTLNHG